MISLLILVVGMLFSQNEAASLNPTEKAFGEYLEAHKLQNPGKPLMERTIQDLREGVRFLMQYAGPPADVSYIDRTLPARDGYPLSVRIFNNDLPTGSPVLIFYPGCAFLFDLFQANSVVCSRIAKAAGIKVALVQFRLAPEHPLPTSLYDGYDAAAYIAAHPVSFGIDSGTIFLGGYCSGAHCAAAVSSMVREEGTFSVYHQVLVSGGYDLTASTHDFDVYEQEDKGLNRQFLAYITSRYYGISPVEYLNPLYSPYFESRFEGLPSTTLVVGEFDALRNDSEAYFRKLSQAGVPVEKILLKGQTHNTIAMRQILSDGEDPACVIARVIKTKLGT